MTQEVKIYRGEIEHIKYCLDDGNYLPYVEVRVYTNDNGIKETYFNVRYYFNDERSKESYKRLQKLIWELNENKYIGILTSWFDKLKGSEVYVIETNINGQMKYELSGITQKKEKKYV